MIYIRFSPTLMRQFSQYSFDDSSKTHSITQAKFRRWFQKDMIYSIMHVTYLSYWPLQKYHNIPQCSLFVTPKFCISIVFSFSWELKWPQEKLKTMLMQNFGVTNKEPYGMLWYFLEWSIRIEGLATEHRPCAWSQSGNNRTVARLFSLFKSYYQGRNYMLQSNDSHYP